MGHLHGIICLLLFFGYLLLRFLIRTALILIDKLPINNILVHIKFWISGVNILVKKGCLPQSLLKVVDMLLDDVTLQVIKFTNNTIIFFFQLIKVRLQIFYLLVQLSLRVQTADLPCSQPFSYLLPTLPFLLPSGSLLLKLVDLSL